MTYAQSTSAVVASRGDYPLSILAIARAAEALGLSVGNRGDVLTVDGAAIVTANGTLQALGPAGVVYLSPLEPPGLSFRVKAGSEALKAYGQGAVPRLFGADIAGFLKSLDGVWRKIEALGIDTKVPRAAMAAGVVALPSAKGIGNPPEWWDDVIELTKPILKSYLSAAYASASAAAVAASASADRWAAIETAVKAIRDLPATVVGAVAGAASDVATGTLSALVRRAWPLLLIAGAVAFAYTGAGRRLLERLKK